MAFLLIAPYVVIAITAWLRYRNRITSRVVTLFSTISIGYWYVIPGSIFLTFSEIQGEDSILLAHDTPVLVAIVITHISFILLLSLSEISKRIICTNNNHYQQDLAKSSIRRLDLIMLIIVMLSIIYLALRFYQNGIGFVVQLISGSKSARDFMSFENISKSPLESFVALLEILIVFCSIFLSGVFAWIRKITSLRFLTSLLPTLIVFISSGTRSVLLLLVFTLISTVICRPKSTPRTRRHNAGVFKRLATVVLIGCFLIIATQAMYSRFADDPNESQHFLLYSAASHNDMFRELVFSIVHGDSYRSDGISLLITPLTFAMPSFLGFQKTIPPHLVDFNYDRAGIDLINGEGNVFPGIISDMYLCFGYLGPLVLVVFSAVILTVFFKATLSRNQSVIGMVLFIALLSYYFISFRNIQGSLAILVVTSFLLTNIFRRRTNRYAPPEYHSESKVHTNT